MKYDQNGLIPAIIQDAQSNKVLMLGYMNEEAFEKTKQSRQVTFFSRSKNRLWTKGESSKNFLNLISWTLDCDSDTLLIKVSPDGPTCHKGSDTCWNEKNEIVDLGFLVQLEDIISNRKNNPTEKSYTSGLFVKGTHKIAQKVGEEAVELVIEALRNDDHLFLNEGADLLFHLMILLKDRDFSLNDIVHVLEARHSK